MTSMSFFFVARLVQKKQHQMSYFEISKIMEIDCKDFYVGQEEKGGNVAIRRKLRDKHFLVLLNMLIS